MKTIEDIRAMYFNSIKNIQALTKEQVNNLIAHYQQTGDIAARNLVVESHLKYVRDISSQFLNDDIDQLDLIQEGNLGLIMAIEHYDVNNSVPFISFATAWIRKYMSDFLRQFKRPITRPHRCDDNIRCISLSTPIGDDEYGHTLEDTLAADEDNSFEDNDYQQYVGKLLRQALGTLPALEEKILRLTYGLDCHPEFDDTIAKMLQLSSEERVREIRDLALRKLYSRINLKEIDA